MKEWQYAILPHTLTTWCFIKHWGGGGYFYLHSVVGRATRYGLNDPWIESRWRQDFPHPSRPTLWPTPPPTQWVLGLFAGSKASGPWRWPPSPTPSSAEVKERVQLYIYCPPRPSWLVIGWNLPLPYKGYWRAKQKICLRFMYMNSLQNSSFISSIPFLLKKSQCKEQINQALLTCFFLNSCNVTEWLLLKLVFLK